MRLYLDWAQEPSRGISDLKPADSRQSWGHSVSPGVSPLPLSKMTSLVRWVRLCWKFPGWILHAKPFTKNPNPGRFLPDQKKMHQQQIHRQNRQGCGGRGHNTAPMLREGHTVSFTTRAEAAWLPGIDNCKIHALLPAPSSRPFHRDLASKSKYSRCHNLKVQKEWNTLSCICLCNDSLLVCLTRERTLPLKHSEKTSGVQKAQVTTLSWAMKVAI